MDDGDLTKELCEDFQDPDIEQPQMIADCCPCNEAKYEASNLYFICIFIR